ncbi:hypothetical protein HF086_007209 [Spodoptera exigua]|uniref:CCHC-type domain-containing protein n=1 Tax=Spodoptera exigua TaxID=7107 RepID=A0A922MSL9_SPOEX|nr:hypothetical protein HF086_007209 [Spodoptera exigua]
MSSDEGHPRPTSEVGLDGARIEPETLKSDAEKLLNNMEMLLSHGVEANEPEAKRFRATERFTGRCNFCGISGHRFAECRKRRDALGSVEPRDTPSTSRPLERKNDVTCYTCGQIGHVTTNCPDKRNGGKAAAKEVHQCEHRPSRGNLTTSSGESVPFLFDSGSSCSLVKEGYRGKLLGTVCKSLVYLSGIGGDDIQCTTQIQADVKIGDRLISLLFHVVSDNIISDPIIIGRDIFDQGLSVEIDNDNLVIYSKQQSNLCVATSDIPDFSKIDTDLQERDKDMLISILSKYANNFIEGIPTKRVKTGRTYKYSHDNLRAVPQGHIGLLEIATSLLNCEEAETASEDEENITNSNHDNDNSDTLTVCSNTVSADSRTLTAGSDTLSTYSDPETWEVSHEAEIHTEQDDS